MMIRPVIFHLWPTSVIYARDEDIMPKLNSVITILTHLKGVVYFFVFFALLSSTRLFKSSESPRQGKGDEISKDIFFFDFSQLPLLSFKFNVFVFIICLCFSLQKIKSNRKKKKKTSHCKI